MFRVGASTVTVKRFVPASSREIGKELEERLRMAAFRRADSDGVGWGTALLATQAAMFLRIVSSCPVFSVRIWKRSGAEKEAFVGSSPDADFLDGGVGGFAHPPIELPNAPVGLQGVPSGLAAQRGDATTRTRRLPASAGRIPSAKRSGR
jgi:hypothetical protein